MTTGKLFAWGSRLRASRRYGAAGRPRRSSRSERSRDRPRLCQRATTTT